MHTESINLLCKSEDKILSINLLEQNRQIKLRNTLIFSSLVNHKWSFFFFFNPFGQQPLYLFNLTSWQIAVSIHPWIAANFSLFAIPCAVKHLLSEQCTLILSHVTLTSGSSFANEWQETNEPWKVSLDKVIKWVLQEVSSYAPFYTDIRSHSTLIPPTQVQDNRILNSSWLGSEPGTCSKRCQLPAWVSHIVKTKCTE